ncbi:MAG TPA: hypothetical protein VIM11_13745 [Tepidisphaeraceae bacterium]|jgi:tetratricopeptide (TPR) repeat protein
MMNRPGFLSLLIVLTGCAQHMAPVSPTSKPVLATTTDALPATTIASSGIEALSLNEILPVPVLGPTTTLTTRQEGPAPVEAVRLFAQARIAMLDGNRAAAIDFLQKATALDPESYQLHSLLGELYGEANDTRAQHEWEKSASIEPDHLELQIMLGRQALSHAQFPEAIRRLRLAQLTSDYRQDDPAAAEGDFLLARGLQESGYDRAALESYERLLSRLQNQQMALRRNPQAAALLANPGILALHIASLYEKHHDYTRSLSVLRTAAAKSPNEFELQAQIVRDTAAAGLKPKAIEAAVNVVQQFDASRAAMALLREQTGSDAATSDRLAALHKQTPGQRSVVYALFDSLHAQNRTAEADSLMGAALVKWPDDIRLIRRQFEALHRRGALPDAAKLIIEAVARRPDSHLELSPLWDRLIRPSAHGRLRDADLKSIEVSSSALGAKLFLQAAGAQVYRGDVATREILKSAVKVRPVFAPAWRAMVTAIQVSRVMPEPEKKAGLAGLSQAAVAASQPALAEELRAQALLDAFHPEQAAEAYASAVRAGGRAPELMLHLAQALHSMKDEAAAVALLRRLLEDRPLCQQGYQLLYEIERSQEHAVQAGRVVAMWLAADPDSVSVRHYEAMEADAQHHYSDERRILLDLVANHDSEPEALAAAQFYFELSDHGEELAGIFEKGLAAEPWNFELGQALIENYQHRKKSEDAMRVAKKIEQGIANDVDLLYSLSGVFGQLGDDSDSERVLNQVLKLDPSNPGANNDLGYLWSEHGHDPQEAEQLIRKAVAAEPNNRSFLDSLGWVLYKQAKFDQALNELTQAAEPVELADPIVLDHLGDTQYRLGNREKARSIWQQAAKRLADNHEDGNGLAGALARKQKELSAGGKVEVAPVLAGGGR